MAYRNMSLKIFKNKTKKFSVLHYVELNQLQIMKKKQKINIVIQF